MKRIYTLIFFCQLYCIALYSQGTIGPEIGINFQHQYHIDLQVWPDTDTIKKPAIFLGLVGDIPITKRLNINVRINYVFRKNTSIYNRNFIPTRVDHLNNELNCNFDILFDTGRSFKLGGGLGLIHKLNSSFNLNSQFSNSSLPVSPKYYLTYNLLLQYEIGKLGIAARYYYVFSDSSDDIHSNSILISKSGFSLGINYKLFGK